ncbi:MAG: thioester reductase domain-containing protein [bacterium]
MKKGSNKKDGAGDIAVIGIACRFPGARNYQEFADNLLKGINSIKQIPSSRWDTEKYYSPNFDEPNKSISKWCGLIDDIDQFDNRFFNISPREANNMDPQQRLLLEETWHCIEDSGVPLSSLQRKTTSVYVGVMAIDYHQEASSPDVITDSYACLGNYECILANRISYIFGLEGASISIDAACASSLVAIHEAKRSLIMNESDYALASGVSLNFHPWKYISFSKSRMLSPDGQCKTFDISANGYVPGEGVGVILLQRLADAIADGNHIYGIIKGSSVKHSGKTLSITAPRVEAQSRVILSAYKNAGVSPDTVSYVEAHGTGTSLGDPIEIESITKAFKEYTQEKQFCKIGSVKTNIGHLEAAAGIAGTIKVLMMLQHRKIPKSLNIMKLNPIINFEDSPFTVATELSDWKSKERGLPLRAGISSFGFGGVNSHVVLEEYRDTVKNKKEPDQNQLFILSGTSSYSMQKLIEEWRQFTESETFSHYSLQDICATLKLGRGAFPYRYGVHVRSKEEIKDLLDKAEYSIQKQHKNYWCLRIGDFTFESLEPFRSYLERFDLFKHHLETITRSLLDRGIKEDSFKDFKKGPWSKEHKSLYSFIVIYAGIRTLIDLGFTPDVITGERAGVLTGLVLSGIITLEDALAVLMSEKKLKDIEFHRPTIPYYDAILKTTVMPFHFDETYLRLLVDEMGRQNKLLGQILVDGIFYAQRKDIEPTDRHREETLLGQLLLRNGAITKEQLNHALAEQKKKGDMLGHILVASKYCSPDQLAESLHQQDLLRYYVQEVLRHYVDKARLLNENQFTFKKYLEEWNIVLKKSGRDLLQLLHDEQILSQEGGRLRKEKLLLMVIIMSCLRRLNQKWNLTEYQVVEETRFYELVDLVTDEVMPKDDLVALLLGDNPDYAFIAHTLNKRQLSRGLSSAYRYIKQLHPNIEEIEDVSSWLIEAMKIDNVLPEESMAYLPIDKIAFFEIGLFHTPVPFEDSVHLKMGDNLCELFTDSLLTLWLHGVDIKWETLYREGTYKKAVLPTYPFDRKSFWLPRIEEKGGDDSTRDQTVLVYKRNFSGSDPITQDHVITGRPLIPGASFIDFGLESVQKALEQPVNTLRNILIQNPSIVEGTVTLDAEIRKNERRFFVKQGMKTLCSGEYETNGTEAPSSLNLSYYREKPSEHIEGLYPFLWRMGYHYRKGLQVIEKVWRSDSGFLIALKKVPEKERILDGIFQAALCAAWIEKGFAKEGALFIPYYIKALSVSGAINNSCFVLIKKEDLRRKGEDLNVEFLIYNSDGQITMRIHDMLFKQVPTTFLQAPTHGKARASAPYSEPSCLYYYSPLWRKQARTTPDTTGVKSAALFFIQQHNTHSALTFEAALRYQRVFFIHEGTLFLHKDNDHIYIQSAEESDYVKLMDLISTKVKGDDTAHLDMYYLWAYEQNVSPISALDALREKQEKGVRNLFYVSKAITGAQIKNPVNLIVATHNVHTITSSDSGDGYGYGGIMGLAHTIVMENPRVKIKLVDLDTDEIGSTESAHLLFDESLVQDQMEIAAYRKGERFIRGFAPFASAQDSHEPVFKNRSVYLIVGGAGSIGVKVAEMIARKTQATLILLGRSKLTAGKQRTIDQLRTLGSEVHYMQGDIANQKQMQKTVTHIKERVGTLNGVIHAAGVLEDKFLMAKEWESCERVLAPKVQGAWVINEITREEPLEFFVVFSSIVSLVGNIGQADYGAANGFLDSFIHYRARNKYPGKSMSINWTLWSDGGMGRADQTRIKFEKRGLSPISSDLALKALEHILGYSTPSTGPSQVAVMGEKFPGFESQQKAISLPSPSQSSVPATVKKKETSESRTLTLETYLKDLIASKLDSKPEDINKDDSFFSLGIESIIVQEIMSELEKKYENLPPTLLFEYPNIRELVAYLKDKSPGLSSLHEESIQVSNDEFRMVSPEMSLTPSEAVSPEALPETFIQENRFFAYPHEPAHPSYYHGMESSGPFFKQGYKIAVVGMSGRFPKSPTVESYWQNLVDGRDCIEQIPRERWDCEKFLHTSYGKWGGFIDDIDKFDPLFFNISPLEAEQMDPQQRLLLECTWETMERAGYGDRNLYRDKLVGVFVGTMWNEYSLVAHQGGFLNNTYAGPGSIYWAIANRISYVMDFKGPSIALDTACSSSLVAVHMACQSILHGDCDMAIAGGVNLSLHPSKYIYLSQAKFLSQDGRCRSFGEGGTGYVPGEGVGTVLLKPLAKAIEDGDHIYGLIRGSSTNHGGKATGFTVPNPEAHTRLITKAFERAHISPDKLGYIECHGTGTILGDPIEIAGLTRAFGSHTDRHQFCPIGSVKSNIGHLEAAAGVAALIKVLLCMEHNKIPKSLHSTVLNSNINFKETPFYVLKDNQEWKSEDLTPRFAGISSFGAGGSNAHLIVESHEEHKVDRTETTISTSRHEAHIIPVSARNEERVKAYAEKLRDFLENISDNITLPEIAYTLQVGREAREERIAFVVSSIKELREKLAHYCHNTTNIKDFYKGNVRRNKSDLGFLIEGEEGREFLENILKKKKLSKAAKLWVGGVFFDWKLFYASHVPRRIALPTYPFARERYWISDQKSEINNHHSSYAYLHPIINQNTSTLRQLRYSTTLSGEEFYLKDHIIDNQKILPAVAYIEMARAAGEIAGERKVRKVKDIVWIKPIALRDTSQSVHIALFPQNHTDAVTYEVITTNGNNQAILHSQGKIIYEHSSDKNVESGDINEIKTRCSQRKERLACYRLFQSKGFAYGPSFQSIQEFWANGTEALSLLTLPADMDDGFRDFGLHPSLMDGALQSVIGLIDNMDSPGLHLPFAMGEVEILQPMPERCYAHVTFSGQQNQKDKQIKRFTIHIMDEKGRILLKIKDFSLRAHKRQSQPAITDTHGQGFEMSYYHNLWERSEVSDDVLTHSLPRHILLFDTEGEIYEGLKTKLLAQGQSAPRITLIKPGKAFKECGSSVYQINPSHKADYGQLLTTLKNQAPMPDTIIWLWAKEGFLQSIDTLPSLLERSVYSSLFLTQALIAQKLTNKVKTIFIYESSVDQPHPLYAALSGFAKTISRENPKLVYKLIDICRPSIPSRTISLARKLDILLREMSLDTGDGSEIRYMDNQRWVKRLQEFDLEAETAKGRGADREHMLRERGVYVITGGAGGLGLIFAEYLAKSVKARLVLTGRSDLNSEKKAKIKHLESVGAEVLYIKADVSQQKDVRALIKEAKARFNSVHGIIHSAGVLRDSFIAFKTKEQMDAVCAPKVYGTLYLDEATKDEALDFFVLFSSITAVMGNPGQADYAFGNSFMDNFATMREGLRVKGARSGKSLSINWPLWKEGGMRVNEQTEDFLAKTMGMRALATESGLRAFEKGLHLAESQFVVVEGDRQKLGRTLGVISTTVPRTSMEDTQEDTHREVSQRENTQRKDTERKSTQRSIHWNPEELQGKIREECIRMVSDILHVRVDDIHEDEELSAYGFDSVSFTVFANKINEHFQLDITPAIFFEYPSIAAFSEYLVSEYHDSFMRSEGQDLEKADEKKKDGEENPVGKEELDKNLGKRIRKELAGMVSDILHVSADDIYEDEELSAYGFDSVSFTVFANKINEHYQLDITPAIFFEYPSIAIFSEYLVSEYHDSFMHSYAGGLDERDEKEEQPWQEEQTRLEEQPSAEEKSLPLHNEPLAIIGISGVMPQSEDLDTFWKHLEQGEDLITEIPHDRWDWKEYYGNPRDEANKTNVKWGGFMRDVDKFDALFFGISPREAQLMDPQQRIFLETVWKAIEDAGYKPSDFSGTKTGVFVGAATTDYNELVTRSAPVEAHTSTGRFHSITANRISYLLNLHGPSEPIDTACSSSLVALHRAAQAIRNGNCDGAIVGGVNVILTPTLHISFSKAGMLCEDGRCKTFDKAANGYARGEGVGTIVIKPLSKAEADGDHIYALIRGTAENHGGHATSLTAPNPNAQAELLVNAYEEAGIDPRTISYIEAHGTGTTLGDPIEINGLKKAFKELYSRRRESLPDVPHCGIGTVKTNIGHLETAAGIAGVLKVLLAMKHKKLPGTVHFKELNPYIQLKGSPFFIVERTQAWENLRDTHNQPVPRRAGVSSFGFGGANAHVILEEYIRYYPQPAAASSSHHLFVLSAKDKDRLKAYAVKMLEFLEDTTASLADIVYTLQIGREPMEERLALVVSDKEELREKLLQFREGRGDDHTIYVGNASQNKAKDNISIDDEEESGERAIKIARFWVSGGVVDWKSFYVSSAPHRISLPPYPFARERHWIKENQGNENIHHPLIDKIIPSQSVERGLVFHKTFYPADFILRDHNVRGQLVLPGVGYLEMVRAAIAHTTGKENPTLSQIVWLRPLTINEEEEKEARLIITKKGEYLDFEVQSTEHGEIVVHARGKAYPESIATSTDPIAIENIKTRCTRQISKERIYSRFKKTGMNYGIYFQGLSRMWAREDEALGQLSIPPECENERDRYILHPTLMDGALQIISGFYEDTSHTLLPFAIEEVKILHPLQSKAYAHVKTVGSNLFHVALLDDTGRVCVTLHEVAMRELKEENFFYVPQWKVSPYHSEGNSQKGSEKNTVLIFYPHDSFGLEKALRDAHGTDTVIEIIEGANTLKHNDKLWEIAGKDPSALNRLVSQLPMLTHVYFLGGMRGSKEEINDTAALDFSQEQGVLSLFRLIKLLSDHNLIQGELQLKVITNDAQQVASEPVANPYAASLFGFTKVMAREYPMVKAHCIDLSINEIEQHSLQNAMRDLARMIIEYPVNKSGEELAIRNGRPYVRIIVPTMLPSSDSLPFQHQGVYVILGGAGGIGLTFSSYLAERFKARLVLLGRSELDSERKEKIAQIESKGGKVLYVRADATNLSSMKEAIKITKSRFGKINGVIHSAIVLRDKIIENMDEESFLTTLAPKVAGSLALYKAVEKEPLDFMLFFSSAVSFFGNMGQSNYTAGCTFKDAFARFLNQKVTYPVKTINWGFWGSVGIASSEVYKRKLTALGAHSIEPEEGMEAIIRILLNPVDQVMALKAEERLLEKIGVELPHRSLQRPAQEERDHQAPLKESSALQGAATGKDEIKEYIKERIAQIIRASLGMGSKEIDYKKSFAEYGVDSIIGIEVVDKLNKAFGISLKNTIVFNYANVADLSRHIHDKYSQEIAPLLPMESKSKGSSNKPPQDLPEPPMKDESVSIKSVSNREKITTIFITGPTGILGGYLLKELLKTTSAKIFCLIRATSTDYAKERIHKILASYGAQEWIFDAFKERVFPIIGDITEENLGLSETEYRSLADSIDCMIHIAASTNLIMPYEYLAPINVQGVKNIIDFALHTKQKYLIHLSSYHVMADVIYRSNFAFKEDDYDVGQSFPKMGYQQTKFEGERLVREASKEGLIWNIVRPGNIFGEAESGLYPIDLSGSASIFHRLFELIVKSKIAAFGQNFFDITPVDYIAKAICYLGLKRNSFYETYHLVNPDKKKWYEIINLLNDYGYKIHVVSPDRYLAMVHEDRLPLNEEVAPEWLNLMKYGFANLQFFLSDGHADAAYTHSILVKEGITCPPIDLQLLSTYLEFYVSKGIIPPPPGKEDIKIQSNKGPTSCEHSPTQSMGRKMKEKNMKHKEYEFIIVGSGAGGATAAKELARQGKKVLIIEQGKRYKKIGGLFKSFLLFDHHTITLWPKASKEGVFLYRAIMAGGSTAVSCGNGTRCAEDELAKLGINLGAEFEEAEKEMNIAPYKMRLSSGSKKILEASKALGYHFERMPKFMRYSHCKRCAACFMGCRYNARWTALDYLDEAIDNGADIIYETAIERVLLENGKARGVVGKGPKGRVEIYADVVILAAGGLGTPVILQKTGIEDAGTNLFGDLIMNTYGVSKDLTQLGEPSMALLNNEFHAQEGFILSTWPQPSRMYRFAEAGMRGMILPPKRTLGIMTKSTDDPTGRVYPDGSFSKIATANDLARLNKGVEIAKEILIKAGVDSKSIVVGNAFGAHPGGTAAIGKIVDSNLQTEIDNLFVCDASVFPSSLGAPPILTIAALAKRMVKTLAGAKTDAKENKKVPLPLRFKSRHKEESLQTAPLKGDKKAITG